MVYVVGARGHDDRWSGVRAGTKVDELPLRRLSVASAAMGRAGKPPMNARGSVSPRITRGTRPGTRRAPTGGSGE
jgi:hypothetical protein